MPDPLPNFEVDYIDADTKEVLYTIPFYDPAGTDHGVSQWGVGRVLPPDRWRWRPPHEAA